MSEDRQHQATCDWNLYPEDRATDPHLCNLGCLDMIGGHDTTVITAADDRGIPTTAECGCGWTWTRPAGDWYADTLPTATRAHRRAVERLER